MSEKAPFHGSRTHDEALAVRDGSVGGAGGTRVAHLGRVRGRRRGHWQGRPGGNGQRPPLPARGARSGVIEHQIHVIARAHRAAHDDGHSLFFFQVVMLSAPSALPGPAALHGVVDEVVVVSCRAVAGPPAKEFPTLMLAKHL
jgi:hypothetical protein